LEDERNFNSIISKGKILTGYIQTKFHALTTTPSLALQSLMEPNVWVTKPMKHTTTFHAETDYTLHNQYNSE
jgi:hypothetical protein